MAQEMTQEELIESKRAEKLALIKGDEPIRRAFVAKMGEVDEAKRIIPFIISTEVVDRQGDTIAIDGWNLDNYKANPVVLWSHNASILPIGRNLNVRVEDGVLKADTQFISEDETTSGHYQFVESIYRLYKNGFLSAKSVGFRPLKYAFNEERGFWDIDYLEQELLEDSCCTIPANPEALIEARSFGIDTNPIAKYAGEILDQLPLDDPIKRRVLEDAWKHAKDHPSYHTIFADLAPAPKKGSGLSVGFEIDTSGALASLDEVKAALEEVSALADEVNAKVGKAGSEAPDEEPEQPTEPETKSAEESTDEAPAATSDTPKNQAVIRLIH